MNEVVKKELQKFVDTQWDQSITPTLMDYIRIPNKSPAFDRQWEAHGHMELAVKLISNWCEQHAPKGMRLEVIRLPGRTPLLFIEIPGDSKQTILMYGHLDKQPEMQGWDADLGPWNPVLRADKLYGRGGADDGYSTFAALTAINALQQQNIPHAHCIILIEACEESGSFDLPFYLEALGDRFSPPDLVIALDSGCDNYDQLWVTTSLRGNLLVTLRVDVLTQGVHSGSGSGVVPSSFRIIRQLLDRVEDVHTGNVLVPELHVDIPPQRIEQVRKSAALLGKQVHDNMPLMGQTQTMSNDPAELLLNSTWRPVLSVTGADGLPLVENAGNVLRPFTTLKLSFRLPPTCDSLQAAQAVKKIFESDPPYNAKVTCTVLSAETGWNAPASAQWLTHTFEEASEHFFNRPVMYKGEGGTIPFMNMLGKKFPQAQFFITGVLGPHSNAHGPNEFLHIPTAKKITASVAFVIAKHFENNVVIPAAAGI